MWHNYIDPAVRVLTFLREPRRKKDLAIFVAPVREATFNRGMRDQ